MKSNHFVLMIAATAFCALLLQPAAAQTLYKSTLPDGRVIYGETPVTGAANVEAIQPDTSKGGLGGTAGGTTASQREKLENMEKARLERERGQNKVQEAAKALKEAEDARDTGKEPYENERIGTAGGNSRLTDAYFERQRRLEAAAENARRKLDEARAGK